MNLIKLQDCLVNFDNINVLKRWNPGSPHPFDSSRLMTIKGYTIFVEYNTPSRNSYGTGPTLRAFVYDTPEERDCDWQRLCDLVECQ